MSDETLQPGLYDQLLTTRLVERLADLPAGLAPVLTDPDAGEAPGYLARHAARAIGELLRLVEAEAPERLRIQARACNAALAAVGSTDAWPELVAEPVKLLAEIRPPGADGTVPRPIMPLSVGALLVNAEDGVNAAAVLKREIASAADVDLICAFVNYTGVRILEQEIRALCSRGALRLITTTYMGATQRRALDALAEWGAQVRVTYERPPTATKLHAKAWLFRRSSGADTAIIGSSNLSHSALMDGLEWNVRLSRAETPQIIEGFRSTFDRYWDDPAFEPYDPERDAQKLDRALQVCGGAPGCDGPGFFLDVTPRPHQVDILEALAADRDRGHTRSLIVAATGTGKTVAAALDYKRVCADGRRKALLFVAHRAEILRQSLEVFRTVLRDGSFGELWVGADRPSEGQHVFASIQSLHAGSIDRIDPRRYQFVIVDEFHHAEAASYRRLLDHLRPDLLVGLTATPERTDGVNVMKFFGDRAAYEMRLWDALEDQLLCPFQYFGIADNVDLSALEWSRGRYAGNALEAAYLARAEQGAALALEWIQKIVTDWRAMRALAFCVSVRHAEAMAVAFRRHGVACMALTSESADEERRTAVRRLREREIQVIFTVDLFNEGVDIPDVDTLLFLRPTESATVFLQQLGRGLRLCEGKPCATVLDFVGQQHRRFRFDRRFRAMTGLSQTGLTRQVEHGFTTLPAGCYIQLDRVTRERVLAGLRDALPTRTHELAAEYRSLSGGRADYPLTAFLSETGIALDDLYRPNRTLTSIRRGAGALVGAAPEEEQRMSRGLMRLLHAVDEDRLRALARLLARPEPPLLSELPRSEARTLYMLIYTLSPNITIDRLPQELDRLWSLAPLRRELSELCGVLADQAPPGPAPLSAPGMADVPLCLHGVYSQDEVMTAFGLPNPSAMRQGVRYFPEERCEVLFVTLRKTETEYSPTTRYNDYPISPALFHWESQNAAGPDTAAGRRYIHHARDGVTILLFVREARHGDGRTTPYFSCGPVDYVRHESARPMRITWRLRTPLPHRVFQGFRAAAG